MSHNLEEAYRICQKLIVLSAGKIVADGNKQTIFEHPNTLTVARLTGCKNISRIRRIDSQKFQALDWNCTLQSPEPVSSLHTHVGIRAHQITFPNQYQENTFPCWLVWTSETPHRMTLYLKLQEPPIDTDDYHLQAEVFKDKWESIKNRPAPWFVCLDSRRLFLLID